MLTSHSHVQRTTDIMALLKKIQNTTYKCSCQMEPEYNQASEYEYWFWGNKEKEQHVIRNDTIRCS